MNILALDLGIMVGWASHSHGMLESGTQSLKTERGESPGMKYLIFDRWLSDLIDLSKPELIGYEQSFLMPTAYSSEIFFGLITRVQSLCVLRGLEHTSVNAMKLKKWASGYGRCSKEQMVALVSKRWKPVTDHNEADAIALLHYILETKL